MSGDITAFEKDFRAACIRHKVTAAFVIAKGEYEKGTMLVIGGCTELSDFVERALLPQTVEASENKH